jgi:hypothetical protein
MVPAVSRGARDSTVSHVVAPVTTRKTTASTASRIRSLASTRATDAIDAAANWPTDDRAAGVSPSGLSVVMLAIMPSTAAACANTHR